MLYFIEAYNQIKERLQEESFGNINTISYNELVEIIQSSQFQKYWKIHKDIITECKNCEYRYMCIDDRLPLLDKSGEYRFEIKCEIKNHVY